MSGELDKWQTRLDQQGENDAGDLLGSINFTSVWSNIETLVSMGLDSFGLQETAVPRAKHAAAKGKARACGFDVVLSDVDPEQPGCHAGVGVCTKLPGHVRELAMGSDEGNVAQKLGRLLRAAVLTAKGLTYNVLTAYGYAGATKDRGKSHRTEMIMEAACIEQGLGCHTATFLTMDLNHDIDRIPALARALEAGDWFDLGALRHLRGSWRNLLHDPDEQSHSLERFRR